MCQCMRFLIVISSVFLLSSCGQYGALTLPKEQANQQKAAMQTLQDNDAPIANTVHKARV